MSLGVQFRVGSLQRRKLRARTSVYVDTIKEIMVRARWMDWVQSASAKNGS